MNAIDEVFLADMRKTAFSEVVADDQFDDIDGLLADDDDTSSESEDMI